MINGGEDPTSGPISLTCVWFHLLRKTISQGGPVAQKAAAQRLRPWEMGARLPKWRGKQRAEKSLGGLEGVQALSRGFLGDTERCPTARKGQSQLLGSSSSSAQGSDVQAEFQGQPDDGWKRDEELTPKTSPQNQEGPWKRRGARG